MDSSNGYGLAILSQIVEKTYDKNLTELIDYYFYYEKNEVLAQQYCQKLIDNKDGEAIKRLIDYYLNDKSKSELFEFFCWAIIKYNNNIYCLEKLAYYYLEKSNYINTLNCFIGIIIYLEINSSDMTKYIDNINSIFVIIKIQSNYKLIFTQLLANIRILNSDIPQTHKKIFSQIVKSIEKFIGL
jgi:hypothetical protein